MESIQRAISNRIGKGGIAGNRVSEYQNDMNRAVGIGGIVGNSISAYKKGLGERFPRLAKGGNMKNAQPYLVGENGPELVIPKDSGTVIPNDVLAKLEPHVLASLGIQARDGGGSMQGYDDKNKMPLNTDYIKQDNIQPFQEPGTNTPSFGGDFVRSGAELGGRVVEALGDGGLVGGAAQVGKEIGQGVLGLGQGLLDARTSVHENVEKPIADNVAGLLFGNNAEQVKSLGSNLFNSTNGEDSNNQTTPLDNQQPAPLANNESNNNFDFNSLSGLTEFMGSKDFANLPQNDQSMLTGQHIGLNSAQESAPLQPSKESRRGSNGVPPNLDGQLPFIPNPNDIAMARGDSHGVRPLFSVRDMLHTLFTTNRISAEEYARAISGQPPPKDNSIEKERLGLDKDKFKFEVAQANKPRPKQQQNLGFGTIHNKDGYQSLYNKGTGRLVQNQSSPMQQYQESLVKYANDPKKRSRARQIAIANGLIKE